MRKPRRYKAEYQRRIRNAMAKGQTRQQARGHPGAGTLSTPKSGTKPRRVKPDPILEEAISAMRAGETLGAAAKRLRVGRERLSAYAKQQAGASRTGSVWTFRDTRVRRVPVIATNSATYDQIRVPGFDPAHLAGEHYQQAEAVLQQPDLFPAFAERWRGKTIDDVNGRKHEFSVDLNQLSRAISAEEIDWARIYRLYMH